MDRLHYRKSAPGCQRRDVAFAVVHGLMRSFQPVMLDLEGGLLPVGQVTGLIHDEPAVAELIERVVTEADAIQKKMAVALAQ